MRFKSQKALHILLLVLSIPVSLFSVGFLFECVIPYFMPYYYETMDVNQYGDFSVIRESVRKEYILSFFPKEISEDFSDVHYELHNCQIDSYGFEVYLEFTIDDKTTFDNYVSEATEGMFEQEFFFDKSFREYVLVNAEKDFVYDSIMIHSPHEHEEEPGKLVYSIEYANIAKILVNNDEQRIIYITLAVHDGGGSDTGFLGTYFDRFGIDPKEYEEYTIQKKKS